MKILNSVKQKWLNLDEAWKFAVAAFLIARLFYVIWSWVILTVQPVAVHYITTDAKPSVIFLNLYNLQPHAYLRQVNGNILSFRSASKDIVLDQQTSSTWDIYTGTAIEGYFKGTRLTPAVTPSDMFPYYSAAPYPNAWLGLWQRFDVNWYTTVAENGYGSISGDDHYPPLFPLLIRLIKPITGNAFLAGLIIAHLATLYALKLLYDLYTQSEGKLAGRSTLLYFLIYPTSFYLFSAYTESLFIVTALLALRAMQMKSWNWAGFWVFCAISTRLQGAALLLPLLYLMWRDAPFLGKIQHWTGSAFAGIGMLFYLFLRSTQVKDIAIPFSEPDWHARLVPPWETYAYAVQTLLSGKFNYIDFLNWFVMTLFVVLLLLGWRKTPMEYNLYTAFSLLIILTRIVETQPLISMSRYSLTLFPVFLTIGRVDKSPWGRRIVIYTCIALSLYLSQEFFGWGWVA
ncbi:MAG: hypothetical protein ABI904_03995 [Chloroflexota bacterium]